MKASDRYLQTMLALLFAITVGFGIACATAPTKKGVSVKSFVEASLQPGSVKSIAVFPLRNVRLLPDELREVNRGITEAFQKQNPKLKIVGATESVSLLNAAAKADKYSEFLRNFSQSGIPDVNTLKEIGKALEINAILQGEVFSIEQLDGTTIYTGAGSFGKTSLTVRYMLLSTSNGTILWDATSNAFKLSEKIGEPAPSLLEVIQMAQEKILTALPTLAQ